MWPPVNRAPACGLHAVGWGCVLAHPRPVGHVTWTCIRAVPLRLPHTPARHGSGGDRQLSSPRARADTWLWLQPRRSRREDSRPRACPRDAGRQGACRPDVAHSGAVSRERPERPGVLPLLCCLLFFWRVLIRSRASLNPEHPWTPRCSGAVNMSVALSAGAGRRPTRLLHSLRDRLLWG